MSITKKFIIILFVGLLPMAIGAFLGIAPMIFLIYNCTLACFLLVDYLVTPKPNIFVVNRNQENKLFFKIDNKIIFTVRNNGNRPFTIELIDEIPHWHFKITDTNLKTKIPAHSEKELAYTIFPTKRGSYTFKYVYARYTGILGLCKKHYKQPAETDYKVYPNLKDLSKYRILLQKRRLLEVGNKTIRLQGLGAEFESLKEYVEGDDFRKINWMSSAREGKLVVNQYEIEKNQPVFMFLDTGRPMSYSINGYKKLDYAINATLILSDIVNQKGDNSGLLVFDIDVQSYISPGKGQAHRNQMMEALYHVQDTKNSSDYHSAFREFAMKQKRRSLVFIFTDFETAEEANDLIKSLFIIKRNHIPFVILMENESLIKLSNMSEEKDIKKVFQKATSMESLFERKRLIRILTSKGIPCIETSAENISLTAVNHYITIKNKQAV